MKYFVTSLLLLALILGLCLWSAGSVTQSVYDTSHLLEQAVSLKRQGQNLAALDTVRAAADGWHGRDTFFGTVLRHDEIDGVIQSFAQLEAYAQTDDTDDFYSNCAALLAQLEHIREMEWPYFENVM